jgi:hypothetical protein
VDLWSEHFLAIVQGGFVVGALYAEAVASDGGHALRWQCHIALLQQLYGFCP